MIGLEILFLGTCIVGIQGNGASAPVYPRTENFRELVMQGNWEVLKRQIVAHRAQTGSEAVDVFWPVMDLVGTGLYYGNAMTAVRLFYEAGYDGHIRRPDALLRAIRFDCNGKMVARLIEYGADPKKAWIGLAVRKERPPLLRFLIEKGAPLDVEAYLDDRATNGEAWRTALQYAARYSRMESMKILIGAKADLNAQNSLTKRTALHEAVVGKNVEGVKLLLRAKAKTNLKDKDGKTAYALAVGMKDRQLTRLLRGRR